MKPSKISIIPGYMSDENSKELKFQLVIQKIGEEINELKVIVWWQVYVDGNKTVFGFSTENGVIKTFPDQKLVGKNVSNCKDWFRKEKAQVVKIAEQIKE